MITKAAQVGADEPAHQVPESRLDMRTEEHCCTHPGESSSSLLPWLKHELPAGQQGNDSWNNNSAKQSLHPGIDRSISLKPE